MTVLDALSEVRDPELDEPITELGFVASATVTDGHAVVRLRLPTYFCAPNFAYLMVADARDAVLALPEVSTVEVLLEDHFAAEQINAGAAAGSGFTATFPTDAVDELEDLRRTFRGKAYLASLDRVTSRLPATDLASRTLGETPPSPAFFVLLRRRAELGLPCSLDSPLLLDDSGLPLAPNRLRFAKTVRVSMEGNAAFCRGMLRTRYPSS